MDINECSLRSQPVLIIAIVALPSSGLREIEINDNDSIDILCLIMFGNFVQEQELLRCRVWKSEETTRTQFDADVINIPTKLSSTADRNNKWVTYQVCPRSNEYRIVPVASSSSTMTKILPKSPNSCFLAPLCPLLNFRDSTETHHKTSSGGGESDKIEV